MADSGKSGDYVWRAEFKTGEAAPQRRKQGQIIKGLK